MVAWDGVVWDKVGSGEGADRFGTRVCCLRFRSEVTQKGLTPRGSPLRTKGRPIPKKQTFFRPSTYTPPTAHPQYIYLHTYTPTGKVAGASFGVMRHGKVVALETFG